MEDSTGSIEGLIAPETAQGKKETFTLIRPLARDLREPLEDIERKYKITFQEGYRNTTAWEYIVVRGPGKNILRFLRDYRQYEPE